MGSETCSAGFSDSQNDALVGMTLFGAVLSMIGSGFIITTYHAFPKIQTFPFRLIMFLSVSDWLASLAYLIGVARNHSDGAAACDDSARCTFASILNQFFSVSSFMWVSVVAFNCYGVLVQQKGRAVEAYERYYHMACWGVALLLTVIAGASSSLGDAGNWCWIRQDKELVRLFCFFLPLLFAILYVAVVFVQISRSVQESAQRKTINFRLRLYLFFFVFINIFSIMNRFAEFVSDDKVYALFMLQAIFAPLQGVCDAIVYGCNASVIGTWKEWWNAHCARKGNTQEEDVLATSVDSDADAAEAHNEI